MTVYLLKSILALVFLVSMLSASLSMLALMGRTEKKERPEKWRRFHRLAGYLFALLLVTLSFLGISIAIRSGDALSFRAVIHGFIGLFLLAIFFLKWLIARFYRQFLRMMPALGMTVFVLSLVIFSMAGYYFLRAAVSAPIPGDVVSGTASPPSRDLSPAFEANVERGASLYASLCASCHYPDREEARLGPGLKGLFTKKSLPHSGKPVTEESIRWQLIRPAQSMPSFPGLNAQETADLMAFLKTL